MSEFTTRHSAMKSYVSALDDFTPPPPVVEVQAQPVTVETNLGFVLTIANLAVTAIIVIAMMIDGTQAKTAIIAGCGYFAVTMTGFALVTTGTFGAVLNGWQRERTERKRVEAYRELGVLAIEWRQAVEANRALELQAQAAPLQLTRRIAALETELLERQVNAGGVQPPSTFVTPYDNRNHAAFAEMPTVDTTAQEAVAWLSGLYNDVGQPDPRKIQMSGDSAALGRLKVRMLGSKRGTGSKEAGLWLLQQGAVRKVEGGYQLNLKHYPMRESLRNLF